jgi:carbamoyl-phosphate synthase large subunit
MTATTSGATLPLRRRRSRGSTRRMLPVVLDLVLAATICVLGFRYLAGVLQTVEALGVVGVLRLAGIDEVSGVVPRHVMVFRGEGANVEIINAVVTASCSSVLSVLGLTALTVVVLRSRKLHALAGLLVSIVLVVLLNHVRLVLSTLAGLWWGQDALLLFHDWVGAVWNVAAILGGFLLMVYVTLPTRERAEQDVAGRHTARRPDSWASPGLGYRTSEVERGPGGRRTTVTGLLHRYVLPRRVSRRLSARREAGRIDYRIGHLPADERAERLRELVADGLGVHTATLLAAAAHDEDPVVLDALAEAVAARQWEPVTGQRVDALRLWARGWLLARPGAAPVPAGPVTGVLPTLPAPLIDVPVGPPTAPIAALVPPPLPGRHRARAARPGSYARPHPSRHLEDAR